MVGVVCHSGTVRFGHYYTYALNSGDGEWYEFNDSVVSHVDAETIPSLTSLAYLLVYRYVLIQPPIFMIRNIELMTNCESSSVTSDIKVKTGRKSADFNGHLLIANGCS